MGKKGDKGGSSSKKKSKKSGKKKGGVKKNKDESPQMTWQEALLAYKINIVERKIEDVRYEKDNITERIEAATNSIEEYHSIREDSVKEVMKKLKEIAKSQSKKEIVEKSDVVEAMKGMWQQETSEKNDIKDLSKLITETDEEISEAQKRVNFWTNYKNNGSILDEKQIRLLEQKIVDENTRFEEMIALIEKTSTKEMQSMENTVEKELSERKHQASQEAFAKLDKTTRQEIQDKAWLKREVEFLKKETETLQTETDEIEQANIEVMEELFDCTLEELQMARSFDSQIYETDDLEKGIYQMGVTSVNDSRMQLALQEKKGASSDCSSSRPLSTIACFILNKVSETQVKQLNNSDDEHSIYDSDETEEKDDDDDFASNLKNEFHSLDHIGPLQLKLLHVRGHKIENNVSDDSPTDDKNLCITEASNPYTSDWMITGMC